MAGLSKSLLLILVATAVVLAAPARVSADSETSISGGLLPYRIQLSAVDEQDFFRRINLPPILDNQPQLTGPSYVVASPYWDAVVREGRDERPGVEAAALYYPQGGFVRARQEGRDVWLVIDLRQRAILDRYIRLGLTGALSQSPGVFEVLRAAAAQGEPISIHVGERELTAAETVLFWQASIDINLVPVDRRGTPQLGIPSSGGERVWLTFTLPEGRSVQLLHHFGTPLLLTRNSEELYSAPRLWLQPVIGEAARPGSSFFVGAAEVPQQDPPGSLLWWPLMLGAGALSTCIALMLKRRFA